MDRAGRAGQVVNLVSLNPKRLGHILPDDFQIGTAHKRENIFFRARMKVIHDDDPVSFLHQPLGQMTPNKTGTACN